MKTAATFVHTCEASTEPLSVADLAHLCHTDPQWVVQIVEVGILQPVNGTDSQSWRFENPDIQYAIEARRLENQLDINLDAVAMLMDMSHEIRRLKALMHVHGIDY